jgi:hypothetical protein
MSQDAPYICECGQPLDLARVLDVVPSDGMGSSAQFSPACSGCGRSVEVRLSDGFFDVGYTYSSGSPHFEPVQRVVLDRLAVTPSDPDDVEVTIGDRRWQFGVRRNSSARYCAFARAFAAGRAVGDLGFATCGVSLTGIEHGGERRTPLADTIVEAGDFLYLSGPAPALTRAWHYINDGPGA